MDKDHKLKAHPKTLFLRPRKIQTVLKQATQDMYRRNYELAQTNKTLSLLRKIDELALESHDTLEVFCNLLASAIMVTAEYPLVGIIIHHEAHQDKLEAHGLSTNTPLSSGLTLAVNSIRIKSSAEWYRHDGAKTEAISVKRLFTKEFGLKTALNEQVQDLEDNLPVKSLVLVKLKARKQLVGLLLLGFLQEPTEIEEGDMLLSERLGEAIGVAVDNKLLFEENKHIVSELQKTNVKLKELDDAKDDFISMASHQLRTPLTSMKGYVSMVIEGDGGRATTTQKQLLGQAYDSVQRMTYLVADLLNVSRLKSGKFIVNPSLVDLAEIVGSEVNSLKEFSRSHGQTLEYDKPTGIQKLNLDEDKTHQVIMNFIDNAIHYTPRGGHIVVDLTEYDDRVEFVVKDDGIGVPKDAQKKLFSKFFRADNAKKMRPDGTGIGLYLAKEVIAAEGGELIFRSEEGKGSVFGFSFAKKGHHPNKHSKKN